MRISDWSSYVCSSDLAASEGRPGRRRDARMAALHRTRPGPRQAGTGLAADPLRPGHAGLDRSRDGPHRTLPRLPRLGWLGVALRRPVRHRLGHHEQLPRHRIQQEHLAGRGGAGHRRGAVRHRAWRSEEHTSELQSLMSISYAVFCLKKNKNQKYRIHISRINMRTIQTHTNTKTPHNHNKTYEPSHIIPYLQP